MNSPKPIVIVLLGPTASGKTELGIEMAEKLNLNIHNVDSRQIYQGMDIGTAKATELQQKRVKHHLLDICEPNRPFTLHDFQKEAKRTIKVALKEKRMALLVGGSGLYIKSVTEGLLPPAVAPQQGLRDQWRSLNKYECHKLLNSCDPISANKISPKDSVRTIRALEVFYATGLPMSKQTRAKPPNWQLIELGLNPENLKERIHHRTKAIFKNGLIEETKCLLDKYGPELSMLQTIGYKEAFEIISGKLNTAEAIIKTSHRTQQLAKRQKTWFKNKHHPKWLNNEQPLKESLSLIQDVLGWND